MKKAFKEFKDFAMKGNVMDMAIGVVIGAAFGKIVSSLVEDIIMPIMGILTGGVNFSKFYLPLDGKTYASLEEAQKSTSVIKYGNFISIIIDFLIISFSIFMVVKFIHRFRKKEENENVKTTKKCPYCKTDINIEASKCPNCTSNL